MNPESLDRTAPNAISGDEPLDPERRFQWYVNNIARYAEAEVELDRVFNFRARHTDYPGPVCKGHQTPSRVLSNLFWLNLPAEAIRREFKSISLLDIGCGSGRYFTLLDRILGGVESYVGVDVEKRALADLEKDPRTRFVVSKAEEMALDVIDGANLIFSQSAMEHVPLDLLCFRRIAEVAQAKASPTLQIHLLPSALMFRQYGPHGYRGYTSRGLKLVIDLFSGFSDISLYTLGGPRSVAVHCDFVFDCFDSAKRDRRRAWRSGYVAAVQAAMRADMAEPNIRVNEACALALVIHSHPQSEIFKPILVSG